ncbi:MAG: iron ABC transporter substrate-binding protein [Burkholderiales bacterium]
MILRVLLHVGLLAGVFASAGVALAQSGQMVVDSAGRRVAVPAQVERIYAAGPPASVVVFAASPEKLLGWTRAIRPAEAAFLPPRYAALPELGRLTGRGNTANVETILALRPDVIIDVGSISPTYASLADRVQQQTGIPYLLFDGRFTAIAGTFRAIGRATGDLGRAERLAEYSERTLEDVRRRVASVPAQDSPRVYYGRGPSGLQTGLAGSINVEILDFLGARNVAAASRGGLVNVSLEQVITWDPEVIITTDPHFYRDIWTDERWAGVAAVRARRVHLAPHLPFGWFDFPPGANRLIGLYWAGRVLYPTAFPDDLRERAKEFFELFYHRRPSNAQLDALVSEPGVAPR